MFDFKRMMDFQYLKKKKDGFPIFEKKIPEILGTKIARQKEIGGTYIPKKKVFLLLEANG